MTTEIPPKRHIILLSGHYGSGKDTFADNIGRCISDFDIGRFSFGGALKDVVVELASMLTTHTLDRSRMDALEYKETTTVPIYASGGEVVKEYRVRHILQYVGTDVLRRYLGDNVFAHKTVDDIQRFLCDGGRVVMITDLRFPNELACVREAFAKDTNTTVSVVRIVRSLASASSHVSETLYDAIPYDFLVENNGTLAQLNLEAKKLICNLGIPGRVSPQSTNNHQP